MDHGCQYKPLGKCHQKYYVGSLLLYIDLRFVACPSDSHLANPRTISPLVDLLNTVEKKAADVVQPWDFFKCVER